MQRPGNAARNFAPVFTRMRTRRRILAACVLLCGVVIGTAAWFRPAGGLPAGVYDALKPGMTREEVTRALGGPPGDYGRNRDGWVESGDGSTVQTFAVPSPGATTVATWRDDSHQFHLFFDDRGLLVAASRAKEYRRTSRYSPEAWLRWRLGWMSPVTAPPTTSPPPGS